MTPVLCRAWIGQDGIPNVWCRRPATWLNTSGLIGNDREGYCDQHSDRRHYSPDWKHLPPQEGTP